MGNLGGRKTHKDYSNLLAELQSKYSATHSASAATAEELEPTSDEPIIGPANATPIIPFADGFPDNDEEWQRARSDERIKYALYFNVIHDKCCPRAQEYPTHMLKFVETYPDDGLQCGDCATTAYIRNGAEDMNNIEKYKAFFQRINLSGKGIRKLYIEHDVRTKIDTDIMTIWYKEDTWKIKALTGTPRVELLHNNYVIRNGQRFFTNGFHTQIPLVDINDAFNYIFGYDYRKHLQPAIESKKTGDNTAPAQVPEPETRVKQSPVSVPEPKRKRLPLRERWNNRIRLFMLRYLDLEYHIHIDGITSVKYTEKPNPGEICAFLWRDEYSQEHWMIGSYAAKKNRFVAVIGAYQVRVPYDEVIAWKALDMLEYNPQPHETNPGLMIIK